MGNTKLPHFLFLSSMDSTNCLIHHFCPVHTASYECDLSLSGSEPCDPGILLHINFHLAWQNQGPKRHRCALRAFPIMPMICRSSGFRTVSVCLPQLSFSPSQRMKHRISLVKHAEFLEPQSLQHLLRR